MIVTSMVLLVVLVTLVVGWACTNNVPSVRAVNNPTSVIIAVDAGSDVEKNASNVSVDPLVEDVDSALRSSWLLIVVLARLGAVAPDPIAM